MLKNRKHSSGIVWTYQKQANESQRHLQASHWYLRWSPNPKNVTKMMSRQSSFCMVKIRWPGWLQPSHMLKNRKHSSGTVWTYQKQANESQRHFQASHWYLRWFPNPKNVTKMMSRQSSFCMVKIRWPGWLQPSHMLKNREHSSGIVWTYQKQVNPKGTSKPPTGTSDDLQIQKMHKMMSRRVSSMMDEPSTFFLLDSLTTQGQFAPKSVLNKQLLPNLDNAK